MEQNQVNQLMAGHPIKQNKILLVLTLKQQQKQQVSYVDRLFASEKPCLN